MPADSFQQFSSWLDAALERPIPREIVGYCLNLYEHEATYEIQVVGVSSFAAVDGEWPGEPIFFTDEDYLFSLERKIGDDDWQRALREVQQLLARYVDTGSHSRILKGSLGVGCGFVDGDFHVLWRSI